MSDNRIQTETHFEDFIDVHKIADEKDRLPGPDGTPGTGMKFSEAVILAQSWWDTKARMMMPDFGKPAEQQVLKSGVMMGLPWFNLSKQEMLRVVAQWYANVGVHTIIQAKSTSQDGDGKKNLAEIRKESAGILPVLSDEGTHSKVAPNAEDQTWAKEYEQIDLEDKLLDAQGETITTKKEKINGKSAK